MFAEFRGRAPVRPPPLNTPLVTDNDACKNDRAIQFIAAGHAFNAFCGLLF